MSIVLYLFIFVHLSFIFNIITHHYFRHGGLHRRMLVRYWPGLRKKLLDQFSQNSVVRWHIRPVMLTRTGHARTRTRTHKDQDKDLNLVLKDKDFTYSYLLQVATKPTTAIKQQQW